MSNAGPIGTSGLATPLPVAFQGRRVLARTRGDLVDGAMQGATGQKRSST